MPIMLGKHTRTRLSAFFTKPYRIYRMYFFFIHFDIHKTLLRDMNKYLMQKIIQKSLINNQ